jgi:glycosyltransferase involved in cell wall biosynthesis
MRPSLSVILPTHDRPEHLLRAVESILSQTRLPCELIIVNDGRQEIPPQIAPKVRAAGVSFRLERRSKPSATASRNLGLSLAAGDVVVLGEDDVTYPPDYFHRLTEMYEADTEHRIGGIGASVLEPEQRRLGRRIWEAAMALAPHSRFTPRTWAARYVGLPPALRGRLAPAHYLMGGAMSLRRSVAAEFRFEDSFRGYTYGEDMEFSFRAGRRFALFFAPGLAIHHCPAPGGRPDMRAFGRLYVERMSYVVARSADGGVGSWLLLGYNFLARIVIFLTLGAFTRRRLMPAFAVGMIAELLSRAKRAIRKFLCGC